MLLVMTRDIQRCFLVLAFTGFLLSCAQETTVSGVSDQPPNSSEQTSPCAPEISFSSAATTSSESISRTEAAVGTSEFPTDSDEKLGEIPTEGSRHDALSTEFRSSGTQQSASSGGGETSDSTVESTTGLSFSHSQGLFRAEIQDGKPSPGDVTSEKLSNPSTGETSTDGVARDSPKQSTSGSSLDVEESTNVIYITSKTPEGEGTTKASTTQSTETHSIDNSSKDSVESLVPSKGDAISNPSDVVKNPTPEEAPSTTPSKVQIEDGEWGDNAKSATRKRSLNATHTLAGGGSRTSSGLTGSPELDASSHAPEATATKTDESAADENGNVAGGNQTGRPPTGRPITEEETVVSSMATEATKSPYTINSTLGSFDVKSTKGETPKSEKMPDGSLHDAHLLSISSDALSSFSEESIHSSEITDDTAQVSTVEQDRSITVATPWGFRESEDSDPVQDPHSTVPTSSPVTFDPNGMTHNYSQEPDSVTFQSEIFHVDGMPSDAYRNPVYNNISEQINQSDPGGMEVHSSEREREGISASPGGTVTREEPDAEEEMSNRKTVQNTEKPTINTLSPAELFSILSTGTPETIRDVNHALTDESEEMLNDSPDFQAIQSKSTTDISKNGFVTKEVEMNVSNDIGHTTGASSQLTSKGTHELDFSIDYQPDQSEIRPVTVTSPLGTPEPATVPPGLLGVETRAPLKVTTMSGQPDTASPDASSPIVLPNPAPSVVNQSTEMASSEATSGGSVSSIKKEENIVNSSIAGVAVKTSVSVSLPLSKPPNGTASSASGEVTDDVVLSPNITGIILPVPIHVNKDVDGHPAPTVVSTEASTEASTVSTGLRIRKPKLKIGGGDASEAPRTRKPFLAPPPKSSTTVGPPVSIFKNARTRMASITSSTTSKPFPQFSTFRIHYASRLPGMVPDGEHVFTLEPVTTTEPTTTETEEPFTEDPFTEPTQGFSMPSEDVVTIVKIAGYIVVDKGLRWNEQLNNRHSPQYKEKSKYVQSQIDRLFRMSGIGTRLWKTEIDGFSGKRKSRSVAIDFFLYIAKSPVEITTDQLRSIFHEKLVNNTFNRFTVDTSKTTFEILDEEPLLSTTEAPEAEPEPVIPQWAIAVIVVGAASLIFIVLFAVVAILGRHHMRRRYSNKLNDEDSDRPSDWESKMAAAYENLAADTIYDAEDLHSDTYKKKHNATFHGRPTRPQRADSWSSSDWSPPPRRPRPQVHRIVY